MRYPVHYHVEPPARLSRLQLAIRLIAFCVLGMLGLSTGLVFVVLYFALPAFAASRLTSGDYAQHDAPRVRRLLGWVAQVNAWAAFLVESLPATPAVQLVIEGEPPRLPARTVLWRVVTGLPSALVLAFLCWLGVFVWVWAALSVLIHERVGRRAARYLEGLQRWSVRLLAYQAGLVAEYPPFGFDDDGGVPATTQAVA